MPTKKDKLNVTAGETVKVKFTYEKLDFGDALYPTYPTLLAANGARHIIGNIWMGATVDAESDGQTHLNALGDDLNSSGGPDDDGVVLLDPWPSDNLQMLYIPGKDGAVKITVTEAKQGVITSVHPAYLHG
ncbi:MAG: hypothetical protein QXL25_07215 [Candidatus Bathyarchaeia archaeon]